MPALQNPGFLVIRSPLLPFAACTGLTRANVKESFMNPLLQEAVFLASPELHRVLMTWLKDEMPAGKEKEKLELALLKYLLRMSYRCTPFGLFAGITWSEVGATTDAGLVERSRYQRHSRLDMDYLCALVVSLTRQPDVKKVLTYVPNNTLYRVAEQFRYVEYRVHKKMRSHHLVNIHATEYIEKVLQLARAGATPGTLASALVEPDITFEEALEFVYELIENQVLVSELEPVITGVEYMSRLVSILGKYPETQATARLLAEIAANFRQIDGNFSGDALHTYQRVVEQLQGLGVPFELGQLFQVDIVKPARSLTISRQVTDALQEAVLLLAKLPITGEFSLLNKFREAFQERYESQEIPLLQVLDAEIGIGYPVDERQSSDNSPLLKEVFIPGNARESSEQAWSNWQQFLFEKYCSALQNNQMLIHLDEESLEPLFDPAALPLPSSLYSVGRLFAPSAEAIDQGNFTILHRISSGPSAGNILGRFCHLDQRLEEAVKQVLRDEEQGAPEKVFAEIVHINQARVGNINMRPTLRDYEIPIMVLAATDEASTIPLGDLMVSVRNNRIVLRSKKLDREVIPRLSTAHNYSFNTLPSYRFLCDLQFQHTKGGLKWSWGALRNAVFLPRVMYKKVVLEPARWMLSNDVLKLLKEPNGIDLLDSMRRVRQQKGIPRWVTVAEGDNELPLDLENELCLKLLQSLIKSRPAIALEECLSGEDHLWLDGPEGRFTSEFVVPLQYTGGPGTVTAAPVGKAGSSVIRQFTLGSEWLYVKIYCGVKTADALLTEVVKPLTEQLLADELIDQWFFIRYADPGPHIRLRFHGRHSFYGPVIDRLNRALAPYLAAHLISRLQSDTYVRELERYGADNIEHSEALFFHDSVAVVDVLSQLAGDEGDVIRWQLALRGADDLLNDAGMGLAAKKALMESLQISFKEEFGMNNSDSKKSLGDKFRKERVNIARILDPQLRVDDELAPAIQAFGQRSLRLRPVLGQLKEKRGPVSLEDLLRSYLHMFLNRMFRSKQRMHEMVLYDLLFQHYKSALGREKASVS